MITQTFVLDKRTEIAQAERATHILIRSSGLRIDQKMIYRIRLADCKFMPPFTTGREDRVLDRIRALQEELCRLIEAGGA